MTSRRAAKTDIVETFVHVSAPASAADDLRNIEKVKRIISWEPGRRFAVYPPPKLLLDDPKQVTPETGNGHENVIVVSSSPSQIPDSQPESPIKYDVTGELDLDLGPSTSPNVVAPPIIAQLGSPAIQSTIFKPVSRPPRATSLEPLNLTPQPSQPTSGEITSPDRKPHKYPLFTSTPKSKPLKHFLSAEEHRGITFAMPKVNSDDFRLIPPDLATLFPLSLFRCKSQSRELADLERGYWRVDLSSWPETEKVDFWKRMRKTVEGGRFGWINILFDEYQEDVLDVFCYGGAAKYVWVLLYVMSTKRTKHGLQFIDASEEVVIQGTTSP